MISLIRTADRSFFRNDETPLTPRYYWTSTLLPTAAPSGAKWVKPVFLGGSLNVGTGEITGTTWTESATTSNRPAMISDMEAMQLSMDTALATKASTTALTTGLATKADATTTTNALATKANSSDMNTALAAKANTTDMNTALGTKANTSDMTTALAGKAPVAGAWTAMPTLLTGFTAGTTAPMYRINNGKVEFKGKLIISALLGIGLTRQVTTMPAGARPSVTTTTETARISHVINNNMLIGLMIVTQAGVMSVGSANGYAANDIIDLTGLSYAIT